jgi:hypothetical protein
MLDEMEFTRPVMKGLVADEMEVLIAAGFGVGVNPVDINLVAFDMAEVGNDVALAANPA